MKLSTTLFFYFILVSEISAAMVVYRVKGTKVLVLLEGSQVKVGQQLQVLDSNNKPVGQLKVGNVSKDRALASLVSGKAAEKNKVTASVQPSTSTSSEIPVAAAAKKAEKAEKVEKVKEPEGPRVPYHGSVLLGLASNNLAIKVGDGATTQNVDNTGNSISLSLAVDRQYFQPWFRARGLVAYEQFNAIGAANIVGCANQTSRDCNTDIKYLSVGGYGKFVKDYSQFQFWGAVGLNIKHPISKSSTALVESSLGTTAAYGLTLGVDYTLETKNFITASVEKQFYLKSDSAETSTIFVRIGVGKEF
jgi:hypothetical protein